MHLRNRTWSPARADTPGCALDEPISIFNGRIYVESSRLQANVAHSRPVDKNYNHRVRDINTKKAHWVSVRRRSVKQRGCGDI
jgi:hypothetical protein